MFDSLPTPCYILDEAALRRNGEILAGVAKRTGCRVLLAQKAFSNYDLYPVLEPYLAGTEASGLYEARLGAKKMPGKEVHVFCGAYRDDEFDELLRYADHIVFNSPRQLEKFGAAAKAAGKSIGLRVNPECSTQEGHAIYDPCSPGSRLGTTRAQWDEKMTPELISLLDGLHFHTLCEQDSDALETTLHAIDEKFGDILPDLGWLNFGGGHHITRPDYDIPRLERCIAFAQEKWNVQVYLEPGEACALNAGYFATRVLDVLKNGSTDLAILDASAACHMPDVIEMPYRPPLYGAGDPGEATDHAAGSHDLKENIVEFTGSIDSANSKLTDSEKIENPNSKSNNFSEETTIANSKPYVYRLGGPTCLAGDVVGDYTFDHPLTEGELLLFGDMAIYTTCKNNTFNGMPLPAIYVRHADGTLECLKSFHYEDFRCRLGR
jgi:carboxynorspermidine decarboxylase